MRAAVATAVREPLSLVERDVPEPGAGEVLVKVTGCGVCYSDLGLLHGQYGFARFPVVPGHEISGVVEALGEGVTWPETGTAVGGQFLFDSDGICEYCVRGRQILCPKKRITGIVVDGGYAEYVILKAGFVTPLPSGIDPVAAAPLMCAGITAFNGLRQGGVVPGSRVAVIGSGGIGALAIRYAVAMGARVAVVGRSRRGEDAARAAGAELFVSSDGQDPGEALRRWDGGAHVILNAAPSNAAAAATLPGLAPDGTLVMCGYDDGAFAAPVPMMVLNRLHVMGSPSGSPADLRDTLAFSVRHGIMPDVTPVALDEVPGVLDAMDAHTSHGRSVIVFG
ncbi:alcohol dehydrogenase catalytic domain-containing protein [Streptomyces sp. 8L]|uniref:alcohol dehydrogenase catalytic domain-containing protein n=1 Tax=Streptomyces sp. 8L TaxID=2877242 RepID=UPI001CD6918C|nr:alcohol dehydrogenase catalytic domain-containing protein [Streptomyces sp. 8L]MCA1221371.1 alcohol dehydrogenase catalytic domain-containing protein [Streptomyces sp. 8L]